MDKGPRFERDVCKQLSLWWTNNDRDDVFWRTSGSGARAKARFRRNNKTTAYSYGDITFIDPIGEPLIFRCVIELKRGYGRWAPIDIIDRPKKRKNSKTISKQALEVFIEQIMEDVNSCGGDKYPVLIFKRDRRQEVIGITDSLFGQLSRVFGYPKTYVLRINTNPAFRFMQFKFFLSWCKPYFFENTNNI